MIQFWGVTAFNELNIYILRNYLLTAGRLSDSGYLVTAHGY